MSYLFSIVLVGIYRNCIAVIQHRLVLNFLYVVYVYFFRNITNQSVIHSLLKRNTFIPFAANTSAVTFAKKSEVNSWIITNCYSQFTIIHTFANIIGKPLWNFCYRINNHTVCPRTKYATKPPYAKFQFPIKRILYFPKIPLHFLQLSLNLCIFSCTFFLQFILIHYFLFQHKLSHSFLSIFKYSTFPADISE